jgi:EmrB/QacA subfamily drug resistance transporter
MALTTTEAAPRAVLIFIGLELGQVMSSLDGTIVATALPTIVDDVGGLSRVTWVVTAYTLAVVASMPLYGKLSDLYGRRRMLVVAITIFLVASMTCGAAQTMNQLLISRFVQGLGGGGLGVLAMATIADIVPARKLGRWLGYQGLIFAVASVLGPVVGGLFVDHLSWRWAFFINLPFGLLALAIVLTNVHLPRRFVEHRLDYAGALLLVAALSCLVLLATLGGVNFGWTSPTALALAAGLVGLVALFVRRERRAAEPVLPLDLLANPVMRACAGINLTSGLLLWCGIFFVPLFLQEVLGVSPTRSGLVLMPLMFGAAFGTLISGRVVERTGRYRPWPIAGGVTMLAGVALLASIDASTPIAAVATFVLTLGLGVGFAMQPSLLAAQNSVTPAVLGTATSTTLLFRSLGNTIGTPILGGILNNGLTEGRGPAAFEAALANVFLAAVPIAVIATVVALRLPPRSLREYVEVLAPAGARTRSRPNWQAATPPDAPGG